MGNESIGAVRVASEKPMRVLVPPAVNFSAALSSQVQRFYEVPAKSRILFAALFPPSVLLVTTKEISRRSIATGEVEGRTELAGIAVVCKATDPDLLVVGVQTTVELLSPITLSRVAHFDHSPFPVCSLTYLPGGRVFAGLSSGKILQWSLKKEQPVVQYYSEGCTQFLAYSARHDVLAADHLNAGHSNVVLYKVESGIATQELSRFDSRCLGLCFVDSRNLITALAGKEGALLSWDIVTGNTLFSVPLAPHLQLNTSFRGLSFLRAKEEDWLLLCTSAGLVCMSLHYDYSEMQFTLHLRGRVALTHEAPVLGCQHEESADIMCVLVDGAGAEVINLFSQGLSNVAVPIVPEEKKNLPLFSLQPAVLPPKPERKKQTNLPLFDFGLPKEARKSPAPSPPKHGPSEDILEKIRSRVEGKPTRLMADRSPTDSPTRRAETAPKDSLPALEIAPKPASEVVEVKSGSSKEETIAEISVVSESEEKPGAPEVRTESVPEARTESASEVRTVPEVRTESTPEVRTESVPEAKQEAEKPTADPKPVETGFQRFLRLKKSELLAENPSLTKKEVVFKASELWGALTEEEQMQFESSA